MRLRPARYTALPVGSPEEAKAVPVAGDAAIATIGTGHGRLIPLVILDTTERPDLAEVIRVQAHLLDGDVVVQWGQLRNRFSHIALFLRFTRPAARVAIIEFEIVKQGILVEHALMSQALYIQAGKAGDRLIYDLDLPKMLIEVPETGFRAHWDKLYHDAVVARIVAEGGLARKAAKAAASSYIQEIREVARLRVKPQLSL